MWTSPYSDFIKPTINDVLISENIPEETLDRRGIDEYFDKLEYIKYRKLYKEALKVKTWNLLIITRENMNQP